MAATYHQPTVPSYQPTVHSLDQDSSKSEIKLNVGQLQSVTHDPIYPLVSASNKPADVVNSNKTTNMDREYEAKETKTDSMDNPETFTCKECGKRMKCRHYLKIHMRIHSGEKPFPCSQCSLSFSARGNLHKHMRIHTGVKNYSCTYCRQMFRDSSSRNRHERLHTGEMPYQCQECKRRFRYREMYKTHMMSVHGVEGNNVVTLPPRKKSRGLRVVIEDSSDCQASSDPHHSDAQRNNFNILSEEHEPVSIVGIERSTRMTKVSDVQLKVITNNNISLSRAAEENVSCLSSLPGQLSTHTGVKTVKAEQVQAVDADEDMPFENTPPDKLMPVELQTQVISDVVYTIRPKSVPVIQKRSRPQKYHLKHLQCSECPKTFTRKSQLARHQKMHKLLTVGTGKSQTLPLVTSGNNGRQLSSENSGSSAERSSITKQTGPSPCELPIDLTADSSILKVDPTLPEMYLQDTFQDEIEMKRNIDTVEETLPCGEDEARSCSLWQSAARTKETTPSENLAVVDHDGVECEVCGRILNSAAYMKAHMRIHSGERPHVCKFCGRGFTVSQNLHKHLRIHTGEKNYACPTCGRMFNTSSSRNRHMAQHNGDKPYPCHLCSEQFRHLDALKHHNQEHHNINLSIAEVRECSKTKALGDDLPLGHSFTAAENILESGNSKNPEFKTPEEEVTRTGQFDSCHSSRKLLLPYDPSSADSNLDEMDDSANNSGQIPLTVYHTAASGQPVVEIELGDKVSTPPPTMPKDINAQGEREDSSELKFLLQGCSIFKESINSEEVTHTEKSAKPRKTLSRRLCKFQMEGQNYVQLEDDMKIHSGARSHTCPKCYQCFQGRHHFLNHLKTHSVGKRFKCEICGKRFTKKKTLAIHKWVHSGGKPYECLLCREQFTNMHILKRHCTRHHPEFDVTSLKTGKNWMTKVPEMSSSKYLRSQDTATAHLDETSSLSKRCFMNIDALSKFGISHRKQIAPVKLSVITSEDMNPSTEGFCHTDSSSETARITCKSSICTPIMEEEWYSSDGTQDFITTINKLYEEPDVQNSGGDYSCSESLLNLSDEGSIFTHSQTHKVEDTADGTCNRLEPYPHCPSEETGPVCDQLSHCKNYQEVQCNENRFSAAIASGNQPNECPVCYAMFSSTSSFKLHMAEHQEQDRVTVDAQTGNNIDQSAYGSFCETKPAAAVDTSSHKEVPELSLEFQGQKSSCESQSSNGNSLPKSESTSVSSNSEACSKCCAAFPSSELLQSHFSFCDLCEYSCETEEDLKAHKKVHNTVCSEQTKDVKCRHCPGMFASYKDLQDHVKVHEGQLVFNCPLCSCVFNQQDFLINHLKKHIDV